MRSMVEYLIAATCSSQHQTQRDHFGKNWTIKAT